jgi:hypothetical protein
MHFHLPKPLHGWRAFAGEVGIIVLGVLIALTAGQLVESTKQRSELRELRSAVDNEIAYDLGTYQARMDQDRCVNSRLEELARWLQSWRDGRPMKLVGTIGAPRSAQPGTNVWASRDPAIMAHMPLEAKLAYGSMYDAFANNEVQRLDERMTWFEIAEFDGARRLDDHSMMRLQGLITRAHWRADSLTHNARGMIAGAEQMGIKPKPRPYTKAEVATLCTPILKG